MFVSSKRNILKIRYIMLVLAVLISIDASVLNAAESRSRSSRASKTSKNKDTDKTQAAQQSAKDIDAALIQMLENLNAQKYPDKETCNETSRLLRTSKRTLKCLEENAQCQHFMLQTWSDYFAGNEMMALKASAKAYRTDPENNDAKLTHAAMAIMTGEKPIKIKPKENKKEDQQKKIPGMLKKGLKDITNKIVKSTDAHSATTTITSSGDILRLGENVMNNEMIGKTVKPMHLDCLNSTVFSYDPQDSTLCAMIWSTEIDGTAKNKKGAADPNDNKKRKKKSDTPQQQPTRGSRGPMGMMGMPMGRTMAVQKNKQNEKQSDPLTRQMDAFGKLFANNFDNHAIQFVAVNIDKSENTRSKILKMTMENPWPWAQVIGKDQLENITMEIPEMPEIAGALVIVDSNGSVRYAGPADNFLAPLILRDIAPKSDSPAKRKNVTKKPVQAKKIATTTTQAQTEEDFDPQAEKLLENAKAFVKMGRYTSYKKGIDLCRNVIDGYPNTKYEQQAKSLLETVPERYRK